MSSIKGFLFDYSGFKVVLAGGPYIYSTHPRLKRYYKVKMAEELTMPCDLAIDTRDFYVPDRAELLLAIPQILQAIVNGKNVYFGCRGGVGRTGFMMAIMAKVMGEPCPVTFTRQHFKPNAVETAKQLLLVDSLDVRPYQELLECHSKIAKIAKMAHHLLTKQTEDGNVSL